MTQGGRGEGCEGGEREREGKRDRKGGSRMEENGRGMRGRVRREEVVVGEKREYK